MAVNVADVEVATPLHCVRDAVNVRLLFDNGADMMVWDQSRDTPAHYAASRSNISCLETLIEAGFDIHTRGFLARTVLHTAVRYRLTSTTKYLLEEGGGEAILYAKDSFGRTPLAAALDSDFDSRCVIEVLLKYGADRELKAADRDRLAC